MNKLRRNNILVSALLTALIAVGSAQEAPFTVLRTRTLEDVLREHGITDGSKQSLIAALQNRDREVRSIAANKLAADGHSDAIPAIESALSEEQDLETQSQLAQALWVLHDPKGVEHLHSMCMNSGLPMSGLLSAVGTLQIIRVSSGKCADTFVKAIIAAISRKNDPGMLAMAVSRLPPMYRGVNPNQAATIFHLVERLVSDDTGAFIVRQVACRALSEIGTAEAAEDIRRVISREADQNLKESFERDLKDLEKKRSVVGATQSQQ